MDLEALSQLVAAAYEQLDRDRRRTDRSISLMIDEVDQLNQGLGRLVEERTTALREREAELKEQNFRFDAALNNMSQGLLMFDSSQGSSSAIGVILKCTVYHRRSSDRAALFVNSSTTASQPVMFSPAIPSNIWPIS